MLARNGQGWLATADNGKPHLIAVALWWHRDQLVVATRTGTPTGRNLDANGVARIALGTQDDAVMIDATVSSHAPVLAASELRQGWKATFGWDPAEEGSDWSFYTLWPVRIDAYRGYAELGGRAVMRDGRWLA
jgi:hypothetical protein